MATIVTKNNSVAAAVPAAGNLVRGELAVNLVDRKLYTKNHLDAVVGVGQEPLISGTNIKTVGGQSLLGSGDIAVGTGDVTLTGTQTLTNKTIEAGTFTNGYVEETFSGNSGTSLTIDLLNGTLQIITLTGNVSFTFPAVTAGRSFTMLLRQDGTGGRTVTWPASVKWPGGIAPTITSTANKTDKYVFVADGSFWFGTDAGKNY
jgi:hypothetical protein